MHINRNTVSFMEWYSLGTPGYYLTRSIETASSMWVNLVGAGGGGSHALTKFRQFNFVWRAIAALYCNSDIQFFCVPILITLFPRTSAEHIHDRITGASVDEVLTTVYIL